MPSSRLSVLCDKIIEAGWLAAVIAAPLFFNVYSSRVFEPDKLTLVRTLASVMAAAWLIKWIEEFRSPRPSNMPTLRTALVLPTLILVGVYLLTTITSITPRVSFFGSYQRLQGTYTTLSYIIIFLMILQGLRTRRQLDRLIFTIILTSLPIALYGGIQRLNRDPLPWGGDVTARVASNMGNPIFVAAYLIMAFFLTLGKMFESFRAILFEEEAVWADILRASGYVLIAVFQAIVVLVLAGSRGPFIGFFTGFFVFGLVFLIDLRRQAPDQDAMTIKDGGQAVLAGAGWYAVPGAVAAVIVLGLSATFHTAGWVNTAGAVSAGLCAVIVGIWLIATRRTWKWLWLTWITIATIAGAFLVVVNVFPNMPVSAALRNEPTFGRLANLIETEGGTGKVRVLIWEGNTQLVPPHAPLRFPDGTTDPLNFLRPLIGYGPESMYVVYNPFYPPDLAHYESRNASPDRSHNETWDSLVITGVIGLLAYQFLFITFFMYGFKSVGMMPTNRARNIFIGLWVGLGLAGGLGFIAVGQPKYFGMGVPGGILAGIILYLIIFSIFFYNREQSITLRSEDRLLFAGLLAGVVAHYIEIHFGIAIASTRVLFWVFAGMMVVAGSGWVQTEEVAPAPVKPAPQPKRATVPANVPRHKKRRQVQRPPERPTSTTQPIPAWVGSVAGYAFITAIIFSTLFYEFVTNAERLSEPTSIVWRALTFLALKQTSSSLVLLMFIFVWIIATVIAIAEMVRGGVFTKSGDWLAGLMLFASISMGLALVFALGLAGQLGNLARTPAARIEDVVAISDRVAGMFNYYYVGVFTLLLLASLALVAENKRLPVAWSTIRPIAWAVGLLLLLVYAVLGWAVPSLVYAVADIALVGSLLVLIASFLPQVKSDQKVIPYLLGIMLTNLITGTYMWVNYSNLDPIRADIIYKQADPYDKQGQWDVSIAHYKHAIELAPNEDFYYLWLGRAYLEKSSSANVTPKPLFNEQTQLDGILHLSVQQTAGLSRTDLLYAARAVLLRARAINPLNTDHSANLARLERRWADLSTDPAEKAKHAELSSQYYAQATSLSPHNAILWNEWALVELVRGNTDSAQQKLEQSIKLDDQFDQTFLLLGQLYLNKQDLSHAAEAYEKSLALNPSLMQAQGELAYVYAQQGKVSEAIQANLNLIKLAPDDPSVWNTHKNLAILYAQAGNFQSALNEARIAASIAPTTPTNYQAQLNDLIKQLGAQLAAPPPQVTATVPTTK